VPDVWFSQPLYLVVGHDSLAHSTRGVDILREVLYTMCMHMNMQAIISLIEQMDDDQLHHLQDAIDRRRHQLADRPLSTVVERRDYQNGVLQLEKRAYKRKDGGLTQRGPYWYFHFREGGRQKTMYLGKTDDPEAKVEEIMTKAEESR
jgi:hypothetical protein